MHLIAYFTTAMGFALCAPPFAPYANRATSSLSLPFYWKETKLAREAIAVMMLLAALGTSCAYDLRWRRIPNACVAMVALAGLLSRKDVTTSVAGAALVLVVLLATHAAFTRARGETGMGGGDVKLLAASALWAGPVGGLFVVAASCLLGLVGRAALLAAGRRPRTAGIPLAPAISVSLLGTLLLGGGLSGG